MCSVRHLSAQTWAFGESVRRLDVIGKRGEDWKDDATRLTRAVLGRTLAQRSRSVTPDTLEPVTPLIGYADGVAMC